MSDQRTRDEFLATVRRYSERDGCYLHLPSGVNFRIDGERLRVQAEGWELMIPLGRIEEADRGGSRFHAGTPREVLFRAAFLTRQYSGHMDYAAADHRARGLKHAGMMADTPREAAIALLAAGIFPTSYIGRELGFECEVIEPPAPPVAQESPALEAAFARYFGETAMAIARHPSETDAEYRARMRSHFAQPVRVRRDGP